MKATQRDVLKVVEELWNRYPEMRFGQLVVNISNWATQVPDGVWDVEDDAFLQAAQSHAHRVAHPEPVSEAGK